MTKELEAVAALTVIRKSRLQEFENVEHKDIDDCIRCGIMMEVLGMGTKHWQCLRKTL